MDKISPVSTNLLYAYKTQANVPAESKNNSNTTTIAPDIVKKETADAAKAYAIVAPKAKAAPEKKSIDELKADLISQGKIERKDFIVRKDERDSQLNIIENGKTVKVYRFMNNGEKKEDFDAIQEFSYPLDSSKGLKQVETMYGADGDFRFRMTRYEKDKSPYKDDIVNYETKPYELEEKLKAEGIKFSRDTAYADLGYTVKITAFDPKKDEITRYEFSYPNDSDKVNAVSKCIIAKNGSLSAEIMFRNDETVYTDFHDNLIPENLNREERIAYIQSHGGPGLKS